MPPHSPPPTSHLMFPTYPTCISRIPTSGREVDGRFSSLTRRRMGYRCRSQSGCTTTHDGWQTRDTYSFLGFTSCKFLEYDECNISRTIHRDIVLLQPEPTCPGPCVIANNDASPDYSSPSTTMAAQLTSLQPPLSFASSVRYAR